MEMDSLDSPSEKITLKSGTMKPAQLKLPARILNHCICQVLPNQREHCIRKLTSVPDSPICWSQPQEDIANYVQMYSCRPPPIFIPTISLLMIGIFVFSALQINARREEYGGESAWIQGVDFSSPLIWDPHRRGQAWRYLTYMLLHDGCMHLIFNMLVQLVLGTILECADKFWRVAPVYLAGVVAGSLAHSLVDPKVFLAGASGGCYALLGAHTAIVVLNWSQMQKGWLESPVQFVSSAVVRVVFIFVLGVGDTGMAVFARLSNPEESSKVGFSAHFGGFMVGLLLGIPVLNNVQVLKWERIMFWICIAVLVALLVLLTIYNATCGDLLTRCFPLLP